jgi:glycosyltransferase involved in cell wall biosynthesis
MSSEILYVLMPVHNGSKTIERAINSVFDQKNVDIDYRLCVVLNNCTDNTEDIVKSCKWNDKIDILKCDTKGIVPALNTGLYFCLSRGATLIARQDADDKWHPKKLQTQIEYLRENPNVDICGTSLRYVKPDTFEPTHEMKYPTEHEQCVGWLLKSQNPIAHPSVVFRSKILERCGGYDNSLPLAEDMSLWFRAIINGYRLGNIEYPLVDYTFVPNPRYNPAAPQLLAAIGTNILKIFGVHEI